MYSQYHQSCDDLGVHYYFQYCDRYHFEQADVQLQVNTNGGKGHDHATSCALTGKVSLCDLQVIKCQEHVLVLRG